jgi:hypothetical protein
VSLTKTLFFVFHGLTFRFTNPVPLTAAIAFTRVLLLIATQNFLDRAETPVFNVSMLAVMVPKGTAAAVLASVPLQLGLTGGERVPAVVHGSYTRQHRPHLPAYYSSRKPLLESCTSFSSQGICDRRSRISSRPKTHQFPIARIP